MQILIDNRQLDFSLEGERVLGEVVSAIDRWLNDSSMMISSLRVDEEELPLASSNDWKNRPIERIERVEIATTTVREMRVASFQTLLEYLILLQKALRERREREAGEILHEYPHVRSAMSRLFHRTGGGQPGDAAHTAGSAHAAAQDSSHTSASGGLFRSADVLLDEAIERSGLLTGAALGDTTRKEVLDCISQTTVVILDRMKEIMTPTEEARGTASLLGSAIPAIADVSVLLQTGKDEEAMGSVLRFSEILSKLLRIIPYYTDEHPDIRTREIEDKTIEQTTTEMNGYLAEIVEAMSLHDSVLVGDLLEYEVAPRANALIKFFDDAAPRSGRES